MNAVSIISVCFGGISLIASLILFVRTINKDTKTEFQNQADKNDKINSQLLELNLMTKAINNTTNDIKADVKSLNTNVNDINTRLVIVEKEQNTMWKKFDEIKEKVNA